MSEHTIEVNKLSFLKDLEVRLLELFQRTKCGEQRTKDLARVEGFIQAGQSLGVISHQEGMNVMNQAHIKVFGKSMAERSQQY